MKGPEKGAYDPVRRESSRCKICQSKYRPEIEEKLNKKVPLVEIIKWVKKQKPAEKFGQDALRRHRERHTYRVRSIRTHKNGHVEITEKQIGSLTEFLDLVISKVERAVKKNKIEPTVSEGIKAAEIKAKIKEDSKWENELLKFFLEVSQKYGHSN